VGDGGLTGEVKPNATSTDSERGDGIEFKNHRLSGTDTWVFN